MVAVAAMLQQGLAHQAQRFFVVAEPLLAEREVVERRGDLVGPPSRLRQRQHLLVRLAGLDVAAGEHRAAAQHREGLVLRLARLAAARFGQRVRRGRLGFGIACQPGLHQRRLAEQEGVHRAVGRQRRFDGLPEQRQAFGEAGAMLEVVEQRRQAVLQRLALAPGDRELAGAPAVLVVAVDRLQRLAVAALARRLELAQPAVEVRRVGGLGRGACAIVAQPEGGELLHQRMQVHAVAVLGQQRLVGERAEHRQRGTRDLARALDREAAVEDGQARERLPFDVAQAPPRMLEHRLDAGVARRVARVGGAQQLGAVAQLVGDGPARQHPRPAGRELDRQRQPLHLTADVDDRGDLGGRGEVRLDPPRRPDEQAHRVEGLGPVLVFRIRDGQALERHRPFAGDRQPEPRGDDDLQPGAGLQQAIEDAGVRGELLEVVEHQQHLLVAPGRR